MGEGLDGAIGLRDDNRQQQPAILRATHANGQRGGTLVIEQRLQCLFGILLRQTAGCGGVFGAFQLMQPRA